MTTTTNNINATLDGDPKTTSLFRPGSFLPFEVSVSGTFIGKAHLQVSYDEGATWITLLIFDNPQEVKGLCSERANTLYRVTWDDTELGTSGNFTSGAASVFIGRGGKGGATVEYVKLVDPSGQVVGSRNAPLKVAPEVPKGGGVTWGAIQAVAMTGSSKTFVPANANRRALIFWNPEGNARAAFDLSAGTVTLAGSVPLEPGDTPASFVGAACPVGAVTAIGTNSETLYYVEGT